MTAVTLENLHKRYGSLVAVDDVSLEVESGEFLCLLGPSGCGKTTTLRSIAGLESPTDGTVRIGGENVTEQPPYDRDTAMVFQSWALFTHKTVLENVAFGLKMQGVDETERLDRAHEMLEMIQMGGYEDHAPSELSGGQKQRVALARSLATDPKVLLLDEPLSNLDKNLREEMQLELNDIHDRFDTTMVHVTHDQNEALTLADRIGIMNDGEIVQVGTPREVYDHPTNEFVEEFLGDTNMVTGEVAEVTTDAIVAQSGVLETPIRIPLTNGTTPPSGGDPISISFRPERLTLHEATDGTATADGDRHRTTGTITNVLYRGTTTRYYLAVDDEELFAEQNAGRRMDLSEGDAVEVSWDADDLACFAADGTAIR